MSRSGREILEDAAEIDRQEDELYGDARGDELPERLGAAEGRRAALRKAKQELEVERAAKRGANGAAEALPDHAGAGVELDPERFVTRSWGRRYFREARRGLDEQRRRQARPIARSRAERMHESARRLQEEHAVERHANAAYEAWRARGIAADGSHRMAPGTHQTR
jgi:hypothetical protein